jgi:hypothetical protein
MLGVRQETRMPDPSPKPLFDLTLNEEQLLMRETARRFADSELTIALAGGFKEFRAEVGVSDDVRGLSDEIIATIRFEVWGDGKRLLRSEPAIEGAGAVAISVNVTGVKSLTIKTLSGNDDSPERGYLKGRAVWGNAIILR